MEIYYENKTWRKKQFSLANIGYHDYQMTVHSGNNISSLRDLVGSFLPLSALYYYPRHVTIIQLNV